jgi:hypothetical protein
VNWIPFYNVIHVPILYNVHVHFVIHILYNVNRSNFSIHNLQIGMNVSCLQLGIKATNENENHIHTCRIWKWKFYIVVIIINDVAEVKNPRRKVKKKLKKNRQNLNSLNMRGCFRRYVRNSIQYFKWRFQCGAICSELYDPFILQPNLDQPSFRRKTLLNL